MNPLIRRVWRALLPALAGFFLLSSVMPVMAAQGGRMRLKLTVDPEQARAEVKVPEGYRRVLLYRFVRGEGWRKVKSRDVSPGVVHMRLPKAQGKARWRAVGIFGAGEVARKFPASFYRGKSRFKPTQTSRVGGMYLYDRASVQGPEAPGNDPSVPVEADIWRIDGSTVFFFNQLRGLQVIDVAQPDQPALMATLRMPAAGEDLYLLPRDGGHDLVLVTRNDEGTRIQLVRHDGNTLRVVARQDVPGWLNDSRMFGRTLVMATTDYGRVLPDGTADPAQSRLTTWTVGTDGTLTDGDAFDITGWNPTIAAGTDWLAVATQGEDYQQSEISVFRMSGNRLKLVNNVPVQAAGMVADKFKMQWSDGVLTVISEAHPDRWNWRPVTVLETFRINEGQASTRLGSLRLAEGESLYATRFAGDKAYVVTFLQTDPLWVVDLTDPTRPSVAGHIEVPGWSTHLEPLGNRLLSIGWDSGTIVASLFDVTDPAAPTLSSRVELGPPGTYSEAAWDEQALRTLPEAGLVLVPVVRWDPESGEQEALVRLLDLDTNAGTLTLRGAIDHAFEARRAELIGNSVFSISQRVLVGADVTDRDAPAIVSEVSLAWPVDRVLPAGDHLIQIEDGNAWDGGAAAVRISSSSTPESILSEFLLGAGVVRDATLRDGKLIVLREEGASGWYMMRDTGAEVRRLHLDLYDATALPDLSQLGTMDVPLDDGRTVAGDGLLWADGSHPCVILHSYSPWWWGGGWVRPMPMLADMAVADMRMAPDIMPYYPIQRVAPRIVVFDVSDPSHPSAQPALAFGSTDTALNGVTAAGDGLVVVGSSQTRWTTVGDRIPVGTELASVHVIGIEPDGTAVPRPLIDLPAPAMAITALDRNGFLVWTREFGEDGSNRFTACASDGHQAFEVASVEVTDPVQAATASGRRLFLASNKDLLVYPLAQNGELVAEPARELPWSPDSLAVRGTALLGTTWNRLMVVDPDGTEISSWRVSPGWVQADKVVSAADGRWLIATGPYGVEVLDN